MILYHATTKIRSERIFKDRCIKKNINRFYTAEQNGDGYTTQDFIYLSNEIFMSMYFANCHTLVDESESIIVFKVDINPDKLEADYDEIRHESLSDDVRTQYENDLECTLHLYKSCRLNENICFNNNDVSFVEISKLQVGFESYFNLTGNIFPLNDILKNCGCNHLYTKEHYNKDQKKFLSNIKWIEI